MPGVQAPVLTVTVPDRDPAAGDILTTNGPGPGQYGPLIYTPQGKLVWFDKLEGGEAAEDLNEQTYEGRRALTWWRGKVLSLGFGQGEDVVMSSGYQTVAKIPGGNGLRADLHDFQIAPNDVSYTTAYNPIRCDLSSIKGSSGGAIVDTAIQEIDMRTGLVRWEWHSLDHVGPVESEVEVPTDSTPWDYFHLNSIDVEGGGSNRSGGIFISARSTWAGYQLEAGTGKVLWRLGGNRSSFKMGPGTKTAWQHDGRVLPDGEVTFFDDGSNPPTASRAACGSRSISRPTKRASPPPTRTQARRCSPPARATCRRSRIKTRSWATAGCPRSASSPPTTTLLHAHLPYDMSFYRAYRFPWSGRPLARPRSSPA